MDYQLQGKRAFVSASTSGIGLAIAQLLAGEGVEVILNGRTEEGIDRARNEILQIHSRANVSGRVADFSNPDEVVKLSGQLSQVDILVNNVGVFTSQSFSDTSDEDWARLFEVNVMGGVRLSRKCLPGMLERGWGRVVFISSECVMLVPVDLIAYSATKAAVHSLSRGLAQMTKGSGVTVNTVVPGSTLSEGAKKFLKQQAESKGVGAQDVAEDFFREERATSLLGRFAKPVEVAQMVLYLASPVSSATNGSVLRVDGGTIQSAF